MLHNFLGHNVNAQMTINSTTANVFHPHNPRQHHKVKSNSQSIWCYSQRSQHNVYRLTHSKTRRVGVHANQDTNVEQCTMSTNVYQYVQMDTIMVNHVYHALLAPTHGNSYKLV